MVIGAFPAAKLGALLLRQVSKPLANYIMVQAKGSPIFRNYICMPPAQFYNWCEVKTKMWILNLGKPVNIPVLNESMAIELGANLLGEAIIFVIAAGVLVAEYNRSSRKEEKKEAAKHAEMEALQRSLRDLTLQLEEQRTQLREMFRAVGHLDSQVVKKDDDKKPDDSSPPTPPTTQAKLITQTEIKPRNIKNVDLRQPNTLNNALDVFDAEFLSRSKCKRELGILSSALTYLFHDVYSLPTVSV